MTFLSFVKIIKSHKEKQNYAERHNSLLIPRSHRLSFRLAWNPSCTIPNKSEGFPTSRKHSGLREWHALLFMTLCIVHIICWALLPFSGYYRMLQIK